MGRSDAEGVWCTISLNFSGSALNSPKHSWQSEGEHVTFTPLTRGGTWSYGSQLSGQDRLPTHHCRVCERLTPDYPSFTNKCKCLPVFSLVKPEERTVQRHLMSCYRHHAARIKSKMQFEIQ